MSVFHVQISHRSAMIRRLGSLFASLVGLCLCLGTSELAAQNWLESTLGFELSRKAGSEQLEVVRNIRYREVDGVEIHADIVRPKGKAVYPLVMMIHGGAWSSGDKWEVLNHAREIAEAGFVVFSINYRLAPQFQIESQEDDCRFALAWAIRNHDRWNASVQSVGLWGYSAGAHLVSLIALKDEWKAPEYELQESPPIACVVAGGAPCNFDFIPPDNRVIEHVMGGTREKKPEVYRQASPTEFARPDAPPFFFFHGTSDFLVPPSSSQALFDKLQSLDVKAEYLVVKDKGHLFTFLDRSARQQAVEFLKNTVGK